MQKLLTENCGGRKSSWWDARWATVNDINNFVYMYNMSPPVNVNNHCFWIFLDRLVCHGPSIAALDPEFCPIGWPAKDSTWWVKKVVLPERLVQLANWHLENNWMWWMCFGLTFGTTGGFFSTKKVVETFFQEKKPAAEEAAPAHRRKKAHAQTVRGS